MRHELVYFLVIKKLKKTACESQAARHWNHNWISPVTRHLVMLHYKQCQLKEFTPADGLAHLA